MKEVNNQNLWNFELGSQESMKLLIWTLIGFPQRDRQDSQNLTNDTFCRLPVSSDQCFIGTEKYPVAVLTLNYDDDDDYSHGFGQIKETFRALLKDDNFQPHISYDKFRSSNVRDDEIDCNLYVFDIRYQQNFTASQLIKV